MVKNPQKILNLKRLRRKRATRSKIWGSAERPRLSVYRSLKHIYAQIINDDKGITLVSASDLEIKNLKKKMSPQEKAFAVGKLIAQKALKKNIEKVVFDRGYFKYHGRIKALAEGAREGGLKF